jgi:hypothetical protein
MLRDPARGIDDIMVAMVADTHGAGLAAHDWMPLMRDDLPDYLPDNAVL